MSYEKLGDYNKAEYFYKQCIIQDPEYDRALFFLANLYDVEKNMN